ncbi:CDP-glycerol glycerophosphotransferase family protein [Pseudorhodobacter aquimaris]|uniref:CDP-glycerol glycerophosphotransferase family protein n=1 Tax=Pseudorhodobacter aquimaris TaxID=687412 RepID=UPI00067D9D05|nr:CDP-glycerol glycerophosphotransferase family protein [Pseudorhodobacter aquimaris]
MIDFTVFCLCAAVVIGVSVWFHRQEVMAADASRVSSDPVGRVTLSPMDKRLRLGLAGITLVALLVMAMLGGGWALVLLAAAYTGVRYCLFLLFRLHAGNSQSGLLVDAVQVPAIQQAEIAFFFSGIDLAEPQHLQMWKDSLDAVGRPWFAILTEAHHMAFFGGDDMPPAILVKDASFYGSVLPKKTKLVLYANNAQKNRAMVASNPMVKHIQLLHGDSDKPPSYSVLTKIYDYVFVAGQMAIDRYRDNGVTIPAERFRIVGRPQLAAIKPDPDRTHDATAPIIGYMPTWRGFYEDTQFSSLDRAARIIAGIRENTPNAKIVFKPHPLSYKDPDWPAYKAAITAALGPNGRFADQESEPFDIYNEVDTLITDISSVMIDYLFSGKPLIVILPELYTEENAWRYPSLRAAYLVDAKLENLADILTAANTDDPMRAKRLEMQKYAFGDYGRPPGEVFVETVRALLAENSQEAVIERVEPDE